MGGYKLKYASCLLQTYCHLSTNTKIGPLGHVTVFRALWHNQLKKVAVDGGRMS